MNREIKFRAWDKVDNKWIKPFCIAQRLSFNYEIKEDVSFFIDDVGYNSIGMDIIISQFTGLKDKNGKEIYEGDIVEYAVQDDGGGWDVCRGSVEFTDCAFQVKLIDGCDFNGSYEFLCDWDKCEVIGNIYEHGDLLNGKQ